MYSIRDGVGKGSGSLARPSVPQAGAVEMCLRAIERIEQAIEEESATLAENRAGDLDGFIRRKSHGLLELTRGMRGLAPEVLAEVIEPRLRPLRARLAENGAALGRHLAAVQEVSGILAQAIRAAESDGTYSDALRSGARA